ncbi:unnamed protein product [Brassica rapa subsp. trilocularis]
MKPIPCVSPLLSKLKRNRFTAVDLIRLNPLLLDPFLFALFPLRHRFSPPPNSFLWTSIQSRPKLGKDAVVGNEQKLGAFWKRVGDYYAASPHGQQEGEKRGDLTCKKRWHRINDQVTKFCAAYSAAERQIGSGESDTDVLKKAHDIFYSDQQSKFTLEHAWCVLRFEQKWLSLNTPKATHTSKRKDGETDTSAAVPDHEIRPEGCKAAKQKRSTVQGKSVAFYDLNKMFLLFYLCIL